MRVIILGAGGHAREVLSSLLRGGVEIVGFYDELKKEEKIHGFPVFSSLEKFLKNRDKVLLFPGVGSNKLRKRWYEEFGKEFDFYTHLDPACIVGKRVTMGEGTFIAPGCILTTDIFMGKCVVINTGSIISHDCWIGDFVFVGPGSNLTGGVIIEEGVELGAGVTVIPGKKVGAWSVVGAGAVVIDDIPPYSVAVGVPARVIRKT